MNFQQNNLKRHRRGLTQVELLVSAVLVGLVVVGAMEGLGAMVRSRESISDMGRGMQLAQQLMTEILNTAYADEDALLRVFGRELDESGANRLDFDDVDDFHGWSASPPEHRDGTPLVNAAGWSREVNVAWVSPANPTVTTLVSHGVKRITVTIRHNGRVVTRLVALRSNKYAP